MSGGGSTNVSAPSVSAPKIDIQPAIDSILKAAEVLVPALQTAGINLNQGVLQSNALLSGYGDISNNALTMQQQLLGLTPVDSKGQQLQQQLSGLRDVFITSEASKDPTMVDAFSRLDAQMAAAYGLKDPTKRQEAFDQAMQSFGSIQKSLNSFTPPPGAPASAKPDFANLQNDKHISAQMANNLISQYGLADQYSFGTSLGSAGAVSTKQRGTQAPLMIQGSTDFKNAAKPGGSTFGPGAFEGMNANSIGQVTQRDFANWLGKQIEAKSGGPVGTAAGTAQNPDAKQQAQKVSGYLQDLQQQMQYSYSSEPQKALTGQQVSQMVQQNPEYQASYSSGMQAIERAAAKGGMLSSGNTLKAAADFGQQLSGSVFSNMYARLNGLSSQTLPLVSQNSAQLPGNSQISYNNAMGPAQARSGSLMATGNLQGQSAMQQAQLQMQASIANQQAQLQASMANAQANASGNSGFGSLLGTGAGLVGRGLGIF